MTTKNCEKCSKEIKMKKECEEMGVAYHARCFRCYICQLSLDEYTVKIREGQLYCKGHSIAVGGLQPFCKVYYNPTGTCYRIITAEDMVK